MGFKLKTLAILFAFALYCAPQQFNMLWDVAVVLKNTVTRNHSREALFRSLALRADPKPPKLMDQDLGLIPADLVAWLSNAQLTFWAAIGAHSDADAKLGEWKEVAGQFETLGLRGCRAAPDGTLTKPRLGSNVTVALREIRGWDNAQLFPNAATSRVKVVSYAWSPQLQDVDVIPAIAKAVDAAFVDSATVAGPCFVRTRSGSDHTFGRRGFYAWLVLPFEPLVLEIEVIDVQPPQTEQAR